MKVLNDFLCPNCGTLFVDQLVDNEQETLECLRCVSLATRVRSVPNFQLNGNDAGFPTAHDRWAKKREQKIAQELKADNS